jgi:hypothetical protein
MFCELRETFVNISPYAVSPEKDFGLKISGIDTIILPRGQGEPIFVQIKTQRNTLTGSQAPRSRRELEIHKHRLFAAVFCTGGNWTFSSADTHRICGSEFWALLGIDYEIFKLCVKKMILNIEAAYIKMIQDIRTNQL